MIRWRVFLAPLPGSNPAGEVRRLQYYSNSYAGVIFPLTFFVRWCVCVFFRALLWYLTCTAVAMLYLLPLLQPSLVIQIATDTDAIIASADPGDYGDRITVAMNIEITADAESTTRAAAVRDAGAKVSQPCCRALNYFQ